MTMLMKMENKIMVIEVATVMFAGVMMLMVTMRVVKVIRLTDPTVVVVVAVSSKAEQTAESRVEN